MIFIILTWNSNNFKICIILDKTLNFHDVQTYFFMNLSKTFNFVVHLSIYSDSFNYLLYFIFSLIALYFKCLSLFHQIVNEDLGTYFLFRLKNCASLQITNSLINLINLLSSCLNNLSQGLINSLLSFEFSKFHLQDINEQAYFNKFIYSLHHLDCFLYFFNYYLCLVNLKYLNL